jgi:predicted amidophosphoribosyltransferase
MREPMDTETRNPGHYDRWTCPGCYADLPNKREGTVVCSVCNFTVECSTDTQPVCVATLVTEDDVG